jgi:hypothetical protein
VIYLRGGCEIEISHILITDTAARWAGSGTYRERARARRGAARARRPRRPSLPCARGARHRRWGVGVSVWRDEATTPTALPRCRPLRSCRPACVAEGASGEGYQCEAHIDDTARVGGRRARGAGVHPVMRGGESGPEAQAAACRSAAESANGRGDVQAGNSRTQDNVVAAPSRAAVAQLASGRHRPRHHLPLQARSRLRPRRRCCQQPTGTPWGRPERVVLPRRVRPREHGAASNTRQLKKALFHMRSRPHASRRSRNS